jgi:peptidylprolyl isomerase
LSAVLLALALVAAACGGDDEPEAAPLSPDQAALPAVVATAGAAPSLAKPSGAPPGKLTVRVITEGTGPEAAKGDLVVMNYVGQVWAADKPFGSSFGQTPVAVPVGTGKTFPGIDQGLLGKKVGSRVLLSLPPDQAFGAQGNQQAGVKPTDTVLFLIDVVARYVGKASAEGTATPAKPGLPVVSGTAGEKPKITLPPGAAPKALATQTLVQGNGPAVQKGQLLVAHYLGVIWPGGRQFDASWDSGSPAAFAIGVGQVITGWDAGLVGVKAGSRVLLVVPPAQGYGPKGEPRAGIKGTDTLVFVVDVLGSHGTAA